MAEGGGHDVGTLRLRVVPYLDQAAMQQVSSQAQSAGNGGGVGGGGGLGASPLGGSPNVPLGVIKARMAMMAANSRLSGTYQAGALGGAQNYAGELSNQAMWTGQNFPQTAFDFRSQAAAANAERMALMAAARNRAAFDTRGDRFQNNLDRANLTAQNRVEGNWDSTALAYQRSGEALGRRMTRQSGAYWGPGAAWERNFADLANPYTAPVGPSLGARAYEFMGGQRGFRRAGMMAMFGAAEAGHAYLAGLKPQRLQASGAGDAQVMQAYRTSIDAQTNGFFMAPISGLIQAGNALTGGSDLITDTYTAIDDAQEGLRAVDAGAKRLTAAGDSNRAARLTRFSTSRYNFVGETERAVHDVAARGLGDTLARAGKLEDYRTRIASESDFRERSILKRDMEVYRKTSAEELKASGQRDTAEIGDINRKANLDTESIRRQGNAFSAMANGEFGKAAEINFRNQQQDLIVSAEAKSAGAGEAMRRTSALAGAARHVAQGFLATGASARGRAYARLSAGDEPGAMSILAERSIDEAIHDAPEGFENVFGDEARAKGDYESHKYWVARKDRAGALMDRQAVSAFAADSKRSSFSAGRMAEVESIYRGATRAADAEFREHRNLEGRTILGTAENDLNAAKNDLFSSVTSFSGSINRVATGGGSGEMTELLRSIDNKLDALKDIGKAN